MPKNIAIVPAILSGDKQEYRNMVESINTFAKRVQIDITDGIFATNQTLDITNVWWPKTWITDLHIMAKNPSRYLDAILKLHPNLCILHAEAEENLMPLFDKIKKAGIKTGLAILPTTFPGDIKQYIQSVDHVLIFAGKLGEQGGAADLLQVEKIPLIRNINPGVEIGWDGGANLSNIRMLAHTELNVINVGSAITKSPNPPQAFQDLAIEADKDGVLI